MPSVSSDSTGVTGHRWLWAPSAPPAAPEQPLAAPLARPRPQHRGWGARSPRRAQGGQAGLSASTGYQETAAARSSWRAAPAGERHCHLVGSRERHLRGQDRSGTAQKDGQESAEAQMGRRVQRLSPSHSRLQVPALNPAHSKNQMLALP